MLVLVEQVNEKISRFTGKMGMDWKESWNLDHDNILRSHVILIHLIKSKREEMRVKKIWNMYFEKYKDDDKSEMFIKIFQHIQLNTYSEAIAETFGSAMTVAQARFRNLEAVNFAKEIFMRLNLPPLHILKVSFISSVVQKLLVEKEFHRRLEGTRWQGKLKYSNTSASVGNFRVREEEISRLPLNQFM